MNRQTIISAIVSTLVLWSVSYNAHAAPNAPQLPQADMSDLTTAEPAKSVAAQAKAAPAAKADAAKKSTVVAKLTPIAATGTMLSLGKVDTEVESELTIITARLTKTPAWKTVDIEDHGTFLQVKLQGTTIPSSGEFLDGNGPYLKKIATFQLGADDGALRLFINQDAAKAKLATTAELLGDRVVITIDHKKLEQLIQPTKEKTAAAADQIVSQTAVKTDTPSPSEVIAANHTKDVAPDSPTTGGSLESLNLKDKLVGAAVFCAGMLVLLLGAQIFKNRKLKSRRSGKSAEGFEPAAMKILSNISISARQKLSLVQVGSQQILLGVSPDNITYITTVETKPRAGAQQSFGNHLLNANPDAEVKLKTVDAALSKPARKPADAGTTARPALKARTIQSNAQPTTTRINVGVGDEGVADMRARGVKNDRGQADQPFDDITKLIRDRLRNLPPSP